MAITYLTTDSIGAGTQFTFAATGDAAYLLAGVTYGNTAGSATITAASTRDDIRLRVDGSVYGGTNAAINLSGDDSTIIIGQTGIASTFNTAGTSIGVYLSGSGGHLTNHGQISSTGSHAAFFQNGDVDMINTGTVEGVTGVFFDSSTDGGGSLVNSGTITGIASQEDALDERHNHGVHSENDSTSITNLAGGRIVSFGIGGSAVHIGQAFTASGDGSLVTNWGELIANKGYGVNFSNMTELASAALINHGVIAGEFASFLGNGAGDNILNSGSMTGQVVTGSGADILVNSGDIFGDVFLDNDADTYDGQGASSVAGIIHGGAGDDTLLGGKNADFIDGGDDNDEMRGRAGDDDLNGADGADLMFGNAGDDSVLGSRGNDTIGGGTGDDLVQGGKGDDDVTGGAGNDLVEGGNGDDTLRGGTGMDTLTGGEGQDEMFGGMDADTFLFLSASESPNSSARDVIRDFESGVDVIDIAALFAGSADFLGTGAFTGTGAEVRYTVTGSGNANVFIDTDGNGSADAKIFLNDIAALTESDFLL